MQAASPLLRGRLFTAQCKFLLDFRAFFAIPSQVLEIIFKRIFNKGDGCVNHKEIVAVA